VLDSPEARNLAFEIARSVCAANGPPVPEEQEFLADLAAALLPPEAAAPHSPSVHLVDVWPATGDLVGFPHVPPFSAAADLDPVLLRYAILTAALELLPQTAGALAIVPAQMKMVYDIGQRHGMVMDRSTVRDFGAALGIGAVTQVLEGGLRKVLSSVLGGLAGGPGKTADDLTGSVAGTALTFATTYALGSIADRYYASGRRLDLASLKAEFTELVQTAQAKGTRYRTEITDKAAELAEKFEGKDLRKILADLRSGPA
jgi:uncharacterized protein (DUF697 family)